MIYTDSGTCIADEARSPRGVAVVKAFGSRLLVIAMARRGIDYSARKHWPRRAESLV